MNFGINYTLSPSFSALEVFDTPIQLSLLERWCCEPLRLGILATDTFLTNKKGDDKTIIKFYH